MTTLADYLLQQPLYAQGLQIGRQGTQTTPVQSWQEGLARTLQGGIGGLATAFGMQRATDERTADSKALGDALESFGKGDLAGATKVLASRPNLSDTAASLGMQAGMLGYKQQLEEKQQNNDRAMYGIGSPGGQPQAAPGGTGNYAGAIANVESGGRYDALGPETGQGRAYGKYQVMPSNIGPWTKEVLGQEMTPQQFLASPQAQDAVFNAKFGQYVQKYGSPQAAARAWFAGEGGMNNPNARDVNGTTVAGYEQKFSAGLGQAPQGAPPQSDTINFQGLQLPRAAIIAATNIRDHAERQKAIQAVVMDAVKFQREGAPVERIRDAEGNERLVPRNQAAGQVSMQNVSPAGSTEGDVNLLTRALQDPRMAQMPEVKAAYDRLAKPQMSQNGQLMYPDMSAWTQLGFGNGQSGVQFKDTPYNQLQMAGKEGDNFNSLKPVKDYREVVPILSSMRDAMSRNDKAADLNLIYGAAKILDPASVVREGETVMWKNIQSLPDWLQQTIKGWTQGASGLSPVARQRLLTEAESRATAYKSQYDAIEKQFSDRAQRYGLNPADVITAPAPPQQGPAGAAGGAGVRRYDPATGRLQ